MNHTLPILYFMMTFQTDAKIPRHLEHMIISHHVLQRNSALPPLPPHATHIIGINGPIHRAGSRWIGDVFPATSYPPTLPDNDAIYTLVFIISHKKSDREELGSLLFRDYNAETRSQMIAKFASMNSVPASQTRLKWKPNHKGFLIEK